MTKAIRKPVGRKAQSTAAKLTSKPKATKQIAKVAKTKVTESGAKKLTKPAARKRK